MSLHEMAIRLQVDTTRRHHEVLNSDLTRMCDEEDEEKKNKQIRDDE